MKREPDLVYELVYESTHGTLRIYKNVPYDIIGINDIDAWLAANSAIFEEVAKDLGNPPTPKELRHQ